MYPGGAFPIPAFEERLLQMSLTSVDLTVKAKSAVFLSVLAVAFVGVLLGSECSRAEGDGPQAVRAEARTGASRHTPPLPQRSKVKKVQQPAPASAPQKVAMAEDKGEPAGQLQPQVHASNALLSGRFMSRRD